MLSAPGVEQCGIVTFLKDGEAMGQTHDRLCDININVHLSRSPRAPALDLPARGLEALVRASVALLQRRTWHPLLSASAPDSLTQVLALSISAATTSKSGWGVPSGSGT